MTLKPGTNLGELNHLPTKVWGFGFARLWAGRVLGLARRCPRSYPASIIPKDQGDGAPGRSKTNSYCLLKSFTEQTVHEGGEVKTSHTIEKKIF